MQELCYWNVRAMLLQSESIALALLRQASIKGVCTLLSFCAIFLTQISVNYVNFSRLLTDRN